MVVQGQFSFSLYPDSQSNVLGCSYNVEATGKFLPVESFFSHVYVVDLSPSLCEVARQRFARLGWKNVSVVCEDARKFRLPSSEKGMVKLPHDPLARGPEGAADLVTMSYSLSMIPGMALPSVAYILYEGESF